MHPLIENYKKAGQGQVFAFYDQLDPQAQERLLAEAGEIDLEEIATLNRTLVAKKSGVSLDLAGLAPAPYERHPSQGG
ncbi:MAG TPA: UDPGP type 1 family protein, partial [Opitutaceae bacterium]|nr:UDPGP type 1 family protein [Opitutaceae bacterium]